FVCGMSREPFSVDLCCNFHSILVEAAKRLSACLTPASGIPSAENCAILAVSVTSAHAQTARNRVGPRLQPPDTHFAGKLSGSVLLLMANIDVDTALERQGGVVPVVGIGASAG